MARRLGRHAAQGLMNDQEVAGTGIAGLDDVLGGGWPAGQLYLILGNPGTGKTTLGLQFLLDGVARGERLLYVTLSETAREVRGAAGSHGWSLEGIELYDLAAAHQVLGLSDEPTMFDPSDVEFRQTTRSILDQIERIRPHRVVFDSLSELSLLARDPLAFRREVLLLKQALAEHGTTTLLLSDRTTPDTDRQLQSLAHGVVMMEELTPEYGGERRRLRITKLRATSYRGGYHDCCIETGGLRVFPRLVASEHDRDYEQEPLRSGIEALDQLMGGGLVPGSTTLALGPAGSGKSSLVAHFADACVRDKGGAATLFLFDEGVDSFLRRSESMGLPMRRHVDEGIVVVRQVDPAELSPGQFAHLVRVAVEENGTRFVGIDSLNGYLQAMAEERLVILQLHELFSYLNLQGVMTMLVLAEHGLVTASTPIDITYIADAVLLTRFFEHAGRIRRALSVMKRRHGPHEDTIREFRISSSGIVVGEPLHEFEGLFSGTPRYTGDRASLLGADRDE